jgi:hypothetical protein
MSSKCLTRARRRLSIAVCVAGVSLGGWLSPALSAQQSTPFDRPAISGDVLRSADLTSANVRRVFFELRLAETEPVRGLTFEATVKSSGKRLNLHYTTVVTNGDVSRARVVETNGRYEVAIRLTDEGAAKMATATARHMGRPVAIVLDGGVVADLTVRQAIGAEVLVSADFTQAEATRIVAGLNKW